MWCTSCRQDVPGIVEQVDSGYICARCGAVLLNDSGIDLSAEAPQAIRRTAGREPLDNYRDDVRDDLRETIPFEPVAAPQPEPTQISTLRWDAANWELNEKLRHVERLTATDAAAARGARSFRESPGTAARYDAGGPHLHGPHYLAGEAAPPSFAPSRLDPGRFEPYAPAETPHDYPPLGAPYAPQYQPLPGHPHAPPGPAPSHNRAESWIEGAASLTSWLFLGLAVGTFCCGGFLAGWGAVARRPELEQLGMPIILGGMLALVLGLLPQIFLRRVEEGRARAPHQPQIDDDAPADAYARRAEHAPHGPYASHADYGRRETRRAESAYYR
jgi:hypothetical protein